MLYVDHRGDFLFVVENVLRVRPPGSSLVEFSVALSVQLRVLALFRGCSVIHDGAITLTNRGCDAISTCKAQVVQRQL